MKRWPTYLQLLCCIFIGPFINRYLSDEVMVNTGVVQVHLPRARTCLRWQHWVLSNASQCTSICNLSYFLVIYKRQIFQCDQILVLFTDILLSNGKVNCSCVGHKGTSGEWRYSASRSILRRWMKAWDKNMTPRSCHPRKGGRWSHQNSRYALNRILAGLSKPIWMFWKRD
jgi:hypothetical protein